MQPILAKLEPDQALALVIDLQEKLLPSIQDGEACLAGAGKLILAAQVFGLPVVVTEQYPAGLGATHPAIRAIMGDAQVFDKTAFSACTGPVMDAIAASGRRQIIIAGVETHVCVQQTALDLLRAGFDIWICVDCIGSRRALDRDIALTRLQHAGVIVTSVESVIFELQKQAGGELFKRILKIVK